MSQRGRPVAGPPPVASRTCGPCGHDPTAADDDRGISDDERLRRVWWNGAVAKNVLGGDLQPCGMDPLTGFYRDGCCNTGAEDRGVHTVCVIATAEFLEFSTSRGNDLTTPMPGHSFPGLRPGDRWCLCAQRWQEALDEGAAPEVVLEATHASTLEWVSLEDLRRHAVA